MRFLDSVKVKLIGFFLIVSAVFLITMLSVLTILNEDALISNASKEVNLATAKIINNLQNKKYRLEEIVDALAASAAGLSDTNEADKAILQTLKANGGSMVERGGIWFEPSLSDYENNYGIAFHKTKEGGFAIEKKRIEGTSTSYQNMEFYQVAKHMEKGDVYWSKVYPDASGEIYYVTLSTPIIAEGNFLGVASLDLRVKEHGEKVFQSFRFPDRYLMMLDRQNRFIIKSELLENYLRIHDFKSDSFNDLSSDFKSIGKLINKYETKGDYNETLALLLSRESSQIGSEEAQYIARMLERPAGSDSNKIIEEINFIKHDPILDQESIVATFYFPNTEWKIIIGIPKDQILSESNEIYDQIIDALVYLTMIATLIGYFLLKSVFINPIEEINAQLKDGSLDEDNHFKLLKCSDRGEIGMLVDNLNLRTIALERSQLRENEEINKRMTNEKLLVQQSKMAAMGEMMDAVAHQWQQPLNALSMYTQILRSDFADGTVDQQYIDEFFENIHVQIRHMTTTLDEFRTFFRPSKGNHDFELMEIVDSVLFLTRDDLMKNSIVVTILQEDKIVIHGSRNEFKHLLLNIISNAKDEFNEKNIQKRTIDISIINDDKGKRMLVCDNAGGIPEHVLPNIFNANFTTKSEGKGTGIGLYMSMQIANKHHATIRAENIDNGACFIVEFDQKINAERQKQGMPYADQQGSEETTQG